MTQFTRRSLGAGVFALGMAPAILRAQGKTVLRLGWTSGDVSGALGYPWRSTPQKNSLRVACMCVPTPVCFILAVCVFSISFSSFFFRRPSC